MSNLTCPCCQTEFPLEAGINNMALKNAVTRVLDFTPTGKLPLIYVEKLFKPATRAISDAKMAKLLIELIPMIESGKIEYKGRVFPAPVSIWRMAFEQMIDQADTLTLPLKSHNYLLTIIAGAADKAAKKQEEVQEMRKRTGRAQQEQNEATAKAMPEAVRNQLQQILNKS